ncbi:heat shock protein Hsp18 [Lutispora thermophila]|uniref:Heat shock protein Hsp20 n=1 Tax=Lutispora thermophila DSM 19022 TaxID=1122184 RepID=A0A1M6FDH4_9FIRM|nr:heat shock protein Hsp18 [Lutispora thermophila]SHI95679.1 heat shock protein Hsp20 [Lutispora thermophila DSM 19022]
MVDLFPYGKNHFLMPRDAFSSFPMYFFDDDFSLTSPMKGNFKVDLKETEDKYLVEADLPGVKKENIDIEYDNGNLTISAKRDEVLEDKKENYVRRERHYGELKRSLYIKNVDENNISASFNDGVLKVTLPKLEKGDDRRKRINIQ